MTYISSTPLLKRHIRYQIYELNSSINTACLQQRHPSSPCISWDENMNKEKDDLKQKLDTMTLIKTGSEDKEKELLQDKETQDTEIKRLKNELENMKIKLESIQSNLTGCLAELASDRADNQRVPPLGAVSPPKQAGNGSLVAGQLPDVSPNAVSVIRKETQGTNN